MADVDPRTPDAGSNWYRDPDLLLGELARSGLGFTPSPVIHGYDDFREIRRGGQGVVYSALHRPTRRRVAVKVLGPGAPDSVAGRDRFRREIDVVAGLQHPHIVRVYDSGFTSEGRLFYSMEQIDGLRLDEYLRAAADAPTPPDLRDALRLFARICEAVHAAHQRGIIHRDLKPGNILVDGGGEPHILDFGLARLVDPPTADDVRRNVTATGEFLGTLAYASPEQLAGDPSGIDIRTDIYSLGVILYELLTGTTPFDTRAPLAELVHAITETPPEAPGARRRGLPRPPFARAGRLDPDLDTITLTAMARSPDRRYPSAEALRSDIDRYLTGRPIEARKDSRWYVFRKLLARYRVAAALLGLLLAVATGSAITLAVWYDRAARAEDLARRQAARASTVTGFLKDLLASPDPAGQGREVLVRDVLDDAGRRIQTDFAGQPEIQAELHQAIGNSLRGLGLYDRAEEHLRQAVDLFDGLPTGEPLRRAGAGSDLAAVQASLGRLEEASLRYRAALDLYRAHAPPDDPALVLAMNNLAGVLLQSGRGPEAEPLLREAAEANRRQAAGRPSAGLALSLSHLGGLRLMANDHAGAEPLFREAMEMYRAVYGERHPFTAYAMHNTGLALNGMARAAEAEPLLRTALAIRRELLGDQHPDVADSLHALAALLASAGRSEEALEACRAALVIQQKALPAEHPSTARTSALLARLTAPAPAAGRSR
jgi:serine/threonine-protein kinase